MKKVISIIVILLLLVACIAGCTKVEKNPEDPDKTIDYIPDDRKETLKTSKEISEYNNFEELYSFVTTEYKNRNNVNFMMLNPEKSVPYPHYYLFSFDANNDGIYVNPSVFECFNMYDENISPGPPSEYFSGIIGISISCKFLPVNKDTIYDNYVVEYIKKDTAKITIKGDDQIGGYIYVLDLDLSKIDLVIEYLKNNITIV